MKAFPKFSSSFPLCSTLLISRSKLSHLARHSAVLDHDIPKNRECGTKNVVVEQPQKMEPSPIKSWTSYVAEPTPSPLNWEKNAALAGAYEH